MSSRVIRFECQPGCTACCRQRGFVYLTPGDAARIAAHLGMTTGTFERRYVYRTRNRLRLRVPRSAPCYFLTPEGCAIHSVKPLQCRTFPFWPELLEKAREWCKTASYCPGIGKGRPVSIEAAWEQAAEMRAAHPAMYS